MSPLSLVSIVCVSLLSAQNREALFRTLFFLFSLFFSSMAVVFKMSVALGFFVALTLLSLASSAKFEELFQPGWATDHFIYEGEMLKLKLDNFSGIYHPICVKLFSFNVDFQPLKKEKKIYPLFPRSRFTVFHYNLSFKAIIINVIKLMKWWVDGVIRCWICIKKQILIWESNHED